ncbi:MAG: preprotein translocase subunit SecA, partial [Candidatus Methylomirabilis sp.]|nr:preprotein translocase subunit SecA [Deltaproteobacteria bacterium]
AIIDEVDSILIDEARTPLIISGQVEKDTHRYNQFQPLVKAAYERQRGLAAKLMAEVRKMDAEDKGDDAEKWWKLLQAERALPKYKDLLDYCAANKDARKQMLRLEGDLMRDKRLSELGEGLLFVVNEKDNNVEITEDGQDIFARGDPNLFEIPDLDEAFFEIDRDESLSKGEKAARKDEVLKLHEERSDKLHNIQQLVKAYTLFERDVEYVVHENEVVIVDEFTGRMMPGRRYSDGLHQALEAKEGVRIAKATQTVATITLQNYFRLYNKLAGMTGTAATEAAEFLQIYKLGVNVIPTNRPMIRVDYPDVIYRTEEEKYEAAVDEIADCRERGQPALVGTVSVEASERLSGMLKRKKIPHEVLNAKNHAKEAEIVAQAGQRGQVTIATNMAGRGTDIVLGEGVRELGGLHIIGTERHESRRIDNQLRGRAGRQGDPGSSRFYLSLEDNLMRLFASDRVSAIMERLGMQRGEAIEAGIVTRAIENAQSRVEQRNFGIRKNLLEYDDVNNQQRKVIYELRRNILSDPDIHGYLMDMVEDLVRGIVAAHTPEASDGQWDFKGMEKQIVHHFLTLVTEDDLAKASSNQEDVVAAILEEVDKTYAKKAREVNDAIASMSAEQRGLIEHIFGAERSMAGFVRVRMVEAIDRNWMDVLHSMDQLKEGIHLRGYGQKNPLIEYKKEGYSVFEEAMGRIREEVVDVVFRSRFVRAEAEPAPTAIPTR